jgi:hypothetical protein
MKMDKRAEAAKWLKLGYETYGPAGVRALANAMGLPIGGPIATDTIPDRSKTWTATHGSGTMGANDSGSQRSIHGDILQSDWPRVPAACPASPSRERKGWRRYVGDSDFFHCGFEGYLEDRDPSPDWPIGECFYDEQGRLVDDNHPYPGCKGTPDSYGAGDVRHLLWHDPGGIWNEGGRGWKRVG